MGKDFASMGSQTSAFQSKVHAGTAMKTRKGWQTSFVTTVQRLSIISLTYVCHWLSVLYNCHRC